jgi:two-component system, LytTR family, sensor kinase
MNSISAFMRSDADRADRMLARLSELLRATLQHSGGQEITLREELVFVDRYLEIQQERFADRLTIERDIAEDTLDAFLPPLILQPIVENAVQHGIANRMDGGTLAIVTRRSGDMLEVRVVDSGGEKTEETTSGTGLGLANTRRRLAQLYGEGFELKLNNAFAHGSELLMRIPFRQ